MEQLLEHQILAAVNSGLARPAIEALLGRLFDDEELQFYRKNKAVYDLKLRKKRQERKYERLSGAGIKRKHDDKYAAIDEELDQALNQCNLERREEAEKSLVKWVQTYCVPLLLNDPPPLHGEEVLTEMEKAISSHDNYMICMSRGQGKTSYVECATLYAIATGLQKYVVVISNNAKAAGGIMMDIFRAVAETDTPFAQDYPELCFPFQVCHGSYRRRQTYRGQPTNIQKNAQNIVFATLKREDGCEYPTSGSLITCRGITSGLRGMKYNNLRPSLILLDDLQDSEGACNPTQVEKLMTTIRKDIMPLGGKERLSILQTATPICADDLVQKIREDKNWKTTVYKGILSFPKNMDKWKEYFTIYDSENVQGLDHKRSLEFYKANFDEMNDGAEVFNPGRYSLKDGHISMLQKLLEIKHQIGESAFASEYQMNPQQLQFALPITPTIVSQRKSSLHELEVPEQNVALVVASSDLNLSKYITTTIVVFMRDNTACVIWHRFRKCRIPLNLPEQDYYQRVYNLLAEHGRELKGLGLKIDAWSIDCNGTPFNAVTDFCRNSMKLCGIPAAGFIGKASHVYSSYVRSRLKEDVNQTLLCGDDDEHKRSGTGRRWTFFNSDYYHELAQKSFLQEVGNVGSLSLYEGNDHTEWAIQICAEKLLMKRQRPDGRFEYQWKSNGDHDALDSIGQALATFASFGLSTGASGKAFVTTRKAKHHRRIKIV